MRHPRSARTIRRHRIACAAAALAFLLVGAQAGATEGRPEQPTQPAPATQVEPGTENPAVSDGEPSPWHVDLALGTVVPMDIGGRVVIEGPGRIHLSLGLGLMPEAYVDIINDTADNLNLYDEAKQRLIEDALYKATTLRAALGWTPWEEWGFYFAAGYAFQGLGGRSSPGEVVRAATEIDPPITGLVDLDVQANLHILTVDLGYKWFFHERLFLQGALGGEFTLAADTSIEPEFGLRSIGLIDRFTQRAEDELSDILTSNVHHPTITILVGARGF
jgi:hypothetical protein